jgi:hypothetical protein
MVVGGLLVAFRFKVSFGGAIAAVGSLGGNTAQPITGATGTVAGANVVFDAALAVAVGAADGAGRLWF